MRAQRAHASPGSIARIQVLGAPPRRVTHSTERDVVGRCSRSVDVRLLGQSPRGWELYVAEHGQDCYFVVGAEYDINSMHLVQKL
ncbi:hypothetical protein TIFTF001_015798 [Ficus carica]|uniref:Uncharacterized protein n=1 Tax=Ficus carica TaxID=3494 RepID=A0AA88DIQ3_FICCA|nr:hypothetical protein TIFTF001_015798 [Ficus carica]